MAARIADQHGHARFAEAALATSHLDDRATNRLQFARFELSNQPFIRQIEVVAGKAKQQIARRTDPQPPEQLRPMSAHTTHLRHRRK